MYFLCNAFLCNDIIAAVSLTITLIIQDETDDLRFTNFAERGTAVLRREHREVAVSPKVSSYVTSCSQENIH